ncbi:terminase large subunit [Vibrio cholerae]|nr:terminase large subunit [Vibrio cholerae]
MTPDKKYSFPKLKPNDQSSDWVHKYCYQVLVGDIVANKWIKLAAERHFRDLKASKTKQFKYEFNTARAQRAIDFYQFTTNVKGDYAGKPIQLMPWQQWVIGSIFGWVTKDVHPIAGKQLRRFKTAEVFVARKNGKSTLASGIALYMQLMDGELGPEVVTAARSAKQARIVFGDACVMTRNGDLKQVARVYRNEIRSDFNNGIFEAVPAEAANLEGKNIHCGIIDEIHVHPSPEVLQVIRSGCGMRSQPLILIISTAGTILEGVAVDQWKYGEEVLEQIRDDDRFFAALYCIDAGDDFTNPDNWIKANPCLGGFKSDADLRADLQQALAIPSERVNFLTKFCNVFVNSADAWLDIQAVQKCKADINLMDYKKRECYIGLDLAQKLDLTAISLAFPNDDGSVDVFFKQYIPQQAVDDASDRMHSLYNNFASQGYLEITDGIATDFRVIAQDIIACCSLFDVQTVGYDPAHATQLSFELAEQGIPMVAVPQTSKNMSEPAKEFEKLIMTQQLRYNGDTVFEWCCSNAYIKTNVDQTIRVMKENEMSVNKIDSVIALITALSLCVLKQPDQVSVYETQDLLFF